MINKISFNVSDRILDRKKEKLTRVEIAGMEAIAKDRLNIKCEFGHKKGLVYPVKDYEYQGETIIGFFIIDNGRMYMQCIEEIYSIR